MANNSYKLIQLERSPADEYRLFEILQRLEGEFIPALSTYVALDEYCHKLALHAENIIMTSRDEDIGFVCCYANSEERVAFISAIAIDTRFKGKGLGMVLLEEAMEVAVRKGMACIRLEVNEANAPALKLYSNAGFKQVNAAGRKMEGKSIYMERSLPF